MIFCDESIELQDSRRSLEDSMSKLREKEVLAETGLSSVQLMEHEARNELMTVDIETDAVRSKIDAIREE